MFPSTPSFVRLLALVFAISSVSAQNPPPSNQFPPVPLANKRFTYPNLPYQVDTDQGLIRGTQHGYNLCNSTTENQHSLCQTMMVNSIDDFCVWAPSEPNSVVANTEGEMVAWCTKPGRGTRQIPARALQGVQFMRTSDYVQVIGFIDQTLINLQADDFGGEMDPHGADLRGNPMGGVVFSNAFNSNPTHYDQVVEWHNFMGGNAFCIKACDQSRPHAAEFCQHIYDRIGCAYNAPNNAQNGTFESCLGDTQDFPGVYTVNGVPMTYTQPPESLGAITAMPYTPRVPASSSCTTYTSAQLYASLTVSPTTAPTSTSSSGKPASTGTPKAGSPSTSGPKPTSTNTSDATAVGVGAFATLLGVVFSVLFLA